MNDTVLFSAHFYNIRPVWVFWPIALFIFLLLISLIPGTPFSFGEMKKGFKIFCCIQCIFLFGHLYAFATELLPYYFGEYTVVEGDVQNYVAPANAYNKAESFRVNGVLFEYNYNDITFGYHDTILDHGVISEDVADIRIFYVHNPLNGNHSIMRIEQHTKPK